MAVIEDQLARGARSGNTKQAKLIGCLVRALLDHLIIGQVFQVLLDLLFIDPGKRIKPLENDQKLRKEDVDAMPLVNMNAFM